VLRAEDVALLDMGAEYHCYCSDITCSFPVSGTFSPDQRAIYTGVLEAQRAVMGAMKPGTNWADMHRLATRVCLEHLLLLGVVTGAIDDVVKAGLGKIFLPCGLGHFIGLDTHDVGGYLDGSPERCMDDGEDYGICRLRTARVLQENMVLTVEPGIYFIDSLLDTALADPSMAVHMDEAVLARFRGERERSEWGVAKQVGNTCSKRERGVGGDSYHLAALSSPVPFSLHSQ
jgi:Xaa-Pro dipeptidase